MLYHKAFYTLNLLNLSFSLNGRRHLFHSSGLFCLLLFVVCLFCFFAPCLCSKKKHCVIYGKWTECMWSVEPQAYEAHKKAEKKGDNKKHKNVRSVRCCSLRLGVSLCGPHKQ